MILEKVYMEIKEKGIYKRGDIELYFEKNKEFKVYGIYFPKPKSKIFFPKIEGVNIEEKDGKIYLMSSSFSLKKALELILNWINSIHYQDHHVTRRAGCFIEIYEGRIKKIGKPKLKYCPLAERTFSMPFTIESLKEGVEKRIKDGAFCSKRCIHRRESLVSYGASEMLADALEDKRINAAIIVCEGAGTVIADKPEIAQGIGAMMTGVFYTTPIKEIIEKLEKEAYVVFPNTAEIDQIKGAKIAKELGYKKIAVTLAAGSVRKLKNLKEIEDTIALALCTTGIKEIEAYRIKEYADLAWACASKNIREIVGPSAFLQIGVQIPVFVITKKGLDLASSRIKRLNKKIYEKIDELDFSKKYLLYRKKLPQEKEIFILEEVEKLPIRGNREPYPLL